MQSGYAFEPEDFSQDEAGPPLAISIFADRQNIRDAIADDAAVAGMRLQEVGDLDLLRDRNAHALGDVIVVDCPAVSGAVLAMLSRLDERAAQLDAQVIVSTSIEGLEDVFACLDRSHPQLLVDPTRGERVIALGRLLTMIPGMKVRDLSDDNRVAMLRLTEQVAQIAQRLERMDERGLTGTGSAFRFEAAKVDYKGEQGQESATDRLVQSTRPALPDPRLVRRVIRQRQLRSEFFEDALFADPAWDILLDLTAARAEHLRVSVTSLCIAAGVPPTTALRWITQMVDAGLLKRVEDDTDRRRAFIALSDKAADAMARYFQRLGQ